MAQAVEKAKLGALRHFLHCRPQEVMKADSLGLSVVVREGDAGATDGFLGSERMTGEHEAFLCLSMK